MTAATLTAVESRSDESIAFGKGYELGWSESWDAAFQAGREDAIAELAGNAAWEDGYAFAMKRVEEEESS